MEELELIDVDEHKMTCAVDHRANAESRVPATQTLATGGPSGHANEEDEVNRRQNAGVSDAAQRQEQNDQEVTSQVDQHRAVSHQSLLHDGCVT